MSIKSIHRPIPVIDLFAGPGGLGEGFSSLGRQDGRTPFKIRLSIEKEPIAHSTLQLRAFFRQYPHGEAPEAYYDHIRGKMNRAELFKACPDAAAGAMIEAWNAELGKIEPTELRARIRREVGDADDWVLIGGPPCQAYSNAGRSRRKGIEGYVPEADPRQYL